MQKQQILQIADYIAKHKKINIFDVLNRYNATCPQLLTASDNDELIHLMNTHINPTDLTLLKEE